MSLQYLSYCRASLIGWLICGLASIPTLVQARQEPDKPKLTFDDHIKPILTQRCSSCHGSSRKESDLDVTNYTALMMGGGSGEVIEAGSPSDSYLYRLVTHEDAPEMPPSGKIPDAEIQLLSDWIEMGALENAGSKPKKAKPKMDLSLEVDANVRPEQVAVPLVLPLEPVLVTPRPSALALASSPWAKLIAIAAPRQVLLYDTETCQLLGVLPFEEGIAHRLIFSRNGSLLLGAGGKDGSLGTVVIWDVSTGERLTAVGQESDVVLAADIRGSHDLVALGGPAKIVKVLSLADGALRFEVNKHTEWITAIEFSPDGKYLATGDRNGGLHVWDTATGAELFGLSGHAQAITAVSWRADSKVLASASEDATLRLWEMDKGGAIRNWNAHPGGVTGLQFLRNGDLASCGRDRLTKTWKQDGNLLQQFSEMSDVAVAVSFCNETNRLIAADWAGQIFVWSATDSNPLTQLQANPPTVQQRITAAKEKVAAMQNQRHPLEQQLTQTRQSFNALMASLAENQKNLDQTQAEIVSYQEQRGELQQQLSGNQQQQVATEQQLSQWVASQPLVEAAWKNLSQALESVPEDQELKNALNQLTAKRQSLEQQITESTATLVSLKTEIASQQQQLAKFDSMIENKTSLLATVEAELNQLQNEVNKMEQTLQEQTATFNAADNNLQVASQELDHWEQHLSFLNQLQELQQQLQQAEQEISDREISEEEVLARFREIEQQLRAAQQNREAAESQARELKDKILQLKQPDRN
jgi:predicted  nucleic acid-binding Zn-ribbon protein